MVIIIHFCTEFNYFLLFFIIGGCNYQNLKIKGPLGSKFYFAITLNDWQNQLNDDIKPFYQSQIRKKTEKLFNNSYFFTFEVNIPNHCDSGQYYDQKRHLFIFLIFLV